MAINLTQYWEDLDISIKDISDDDAQIQSRIIDKLAKRLDVDKGWGKVIKIVLATNAAPRTVLAELYANDKKGFYNIYAVVKFAENIITNKSLLGDLANTVLTDGYRETLNLRLDTPAPLAFPLFLTNPEYLIDVYCKDTIKQSNLRVYTCESASEDNIIQLGFDKTRIQGILNDFEASKRKNQRRRNRAWWVLADNNKFIVFFRREKKGRTAVRRVDKNRFMKTADRKVFIFSKGGKQLELHSNREPKRAIKIANYIASRVYNQNIEYSEKIVQVPQAHITGFITAIKQSRVQVLEIRVINAPLDGSPAINLRSSGGSPVNNAITQLDRKQINLISDPTKIKNARIKINNKVFNLKFEHQRDGVKITCNNKGYGEDEKRSVAEFFNTYGQ